MPVSTASEKNTTVHVFLVVLKAESVPGRRLRDYAGAQRRWPRCRRPAGQAFLFLVAVALGAIAVVDTDGAAEGV
jgi:hypothetical protein